MLTYLGVREFTVTTRNEVSMTTQTTNLIQTDTRARIVARVDAFFTALGQGMNAYILRKSRMPEIDALNAKTDAELAAMGLTRDDIPRHVFRDLFYV
jgi:uncharacterized protein YjiS (DUF1127 family)